MKPVRIAQARPVDDFRVELTLTDDRVIERDFDTVLEGPVFVEIRNDPARFRELCAEAGTIVWPSGADLCPDVLIWGGLPPADPVVNAA